MKIGIIGLPGSGKSTLFDLLTGTFGGPDYRQAAHKPRMRTVKVEDPRLTRLRDDYQPKKFTPASLEILDFPAVSGGQDDRSGLVDLLQPAREMDALLIVLRDFPNPAVPGGETVDPLRDLNEVCGELIISDLVIAERRLEKLAEKSRKPTYTDDDRKESALLETVRAHLETEKSVVELGLSAEDKKRLGGFAFLSGKPAVPILSGERGSVPASELEPFLALCGRGGVAIAARNELEILQLPEADREVFLAEYGITEFRGDSVIAAAYRAAGLISFFTAGDKEVRAWTIPAGTAAPQAAGAIHTDFERGFIRAEVVSYEDYLALGGVKGAKEKGQYRQEGREYEVCDADIVEFRFSV
jgi:GTP-binding protein YchF